MRLTFTGLEIDGFKSFVGEPHLLPLADYGPGLHFVRGRNEAEPRLGPNGAGKSTLWDALTWCLYGKTPDGSRNPDIKPWHGQKHTTVELMVRVDRKEHSITREANPNTLLLDDKPVGQEQIDSLIGLSFAAFTHTVLLGQGQPLFFDLPPRDKLQLFSDVLELERWEQRSAAAATRARELEQQKDMLEGTIIGLQASWENLITIRDENKAKSATWEAERAGTLAKANDQLKDITKRLNDAQKQYDKLDPKYDWTCTQIKLIRDDLDRLRDVTGPASILELTRRRLAKDLEGPAPEVCPTCGQQIDPKDIGRHRSELRHQLKEIDAELRKSAKAKKQFQALQDSLTTYQADADSLKAEMEPMVRTLADLRAQKNELERTITKYEDEANPYRSQQQDLRKRLDRIATELREHGMEILKLGRRIERARFWIKGFKDVRLFIIEDVLQELELATNASLEDVGLIGWSVKYDMEKETKSGSIQRGLNVTIMSPVTKQRVRWESWSGGEGQRLRVIGALALSEVLLDHAGVQTSLEILDEPAHFMAPDGVRDLCDFLAARASSLGKRIFYIDHMAIDSSSFASVTTVVKTKQGSHLETDGGG